MTLLSSSVSRFLRPPDKFIDRTAFRAAETLIPRLANSMVFSLPAFL